MKRFRPAIVRFAPRAGRLARRWPAVRLQWRRGAVARELSAGARQRPGPGPSWPTHIHLHLSSLHLSSLHLSSLHLGSQHMGWQPLLARAHSWARPISTPLASEAPAAALRGAASGPARAATVRMAHQAHAGMPLRAQAVSAYRYRTQPGATERAPALPFHAASARGPETSSAPRRTRRAAVPASPPLPAPRQAQARAADQAAAPVMHGMLHRAPAARAPAAAAAWKATPAASRRALPRSAGMAPRALPVPLAAATLWPSNTVPMVWRRPGAARLAASGEPAIDPGPLALATAAPVQHRAPVPAPAASTATLPAPLRQQLQAGALDPALADRLADEVIRRVERSMRIERERRGH